MNKARNLIIFAIVAITCGWFGVWINTRVESPSPQASLGLLVWITAPLLSGLLLRGFGGDGWSDFGLRLNFRENWGWYALSILIYPVTIALSIGLSLFFGAASQEISFSELLPIFIAGIAGSLVKNIGEEFAWRGYLTPRFKALGLSDFTNHMLTATIWGLWHIPYWIFFLGEEIINNYGNFGMTWFIVLGIIGIYPTALVFGELRLKTNSVWAPYIAHNITNALSAQLIIEGFIEFKPNAELLFSPNTDGLLLIILFWAAGLWMLKRRKSER